MAVQGPLAFRANVCLVIVWFPSGAKPVCAVVAVIPHHLRLQQESERGQKQERDSSGFI